ncbi:Cyclic diguanosine monophosphate-binding protein [Candidatus Accumulibacter aalborgensis]|uniref:Cyclic diguanosine monophosphate-binding protein n=1 Tax=Candidatus Accumulibacter aalborgensis TaxID=1860102 RepID=A0A1A8XGQ1_9PROT|nr:PilZ domain-containing protein [Candidatus Accumulibacter aalborgensis]SBT03113.1 Cyclic diguanosine monophosphate-binding protein [Candidatus Accumulibacter aalborgensis]
MNADRRHSSRIAFASPAQLILADRKLEVQVLDLSVKGALVGLPEDADVVGGATSVLHINLEDGEEICMEGTIAHVEGRQAGLVCHSIDIDSVTHLRRLVELNIGNADLLQRELSALLAQHSGS